MKIGIVIPAYNEHENIINLIKKINKNANSFIVIVDDSSTDKTKKLFKKKRKNILYIHRGKKLGRGSAVIFGLKRLLRIKNVSCYMEMDADMSHNPSEIKKKN